jgi:hypothetical protein
VVKNFGSKRLKQKDGTMEISKSPSDGLAVELPLIIIKELKVLH